MVASDLLMDIIDFSKARRLREADLFDLMAWLTPRSPGIAPSRRFSEAIQALS